MKYTDDSLMPWGEHRNKPLSEVPDDYFLFLWERSQRFAPGTTARANNKPLFDYIADNIDAIRANVARRSNRK